MQTGATINVHLKYQNGGQQHLSDFDFFRQAGVSVSESADLL